MEIRRAVIERPWPNLLEHYTYHPLWDTWLEQHSVTIRRLGRTPVKTAQDSNVSRSRRESDRPKTIASSISSRVVTVKNIFGEPVTMDVARRYSKGDWDIKLLTSDCHKCPLFIPKDQATRAVNTPGAVAVKARAGMEGLCMFGYSGKFHLRKVVIRNPNQTSECSIPIYDRETRIKFKRKLGDFFTAPQ